MLENLTAHAKRRYKGKTLYSKNALEKFSLINSLAGTGNNVLEVACGDGTLSEMMRKKNQVTGVDIDDCDLQKDSLPFYNSSFNVVVAVEIIEHIWDCDRFLQDIKRVLEPEGRLIITTPNLASLGRRLMLLKGTSPYVDNFIYPDEAGHIKHFTRKDFGYLLEKNGFKVENWWSDVVNFTSNGKRYSAVLATFFPRLGRSIIAECRK